MAAQQVVPLWQDKSRRSQLARLQGAPFKIVQSEQGKAAKEAAEALKRSGSERGKGIGRIPRAHSFDAVLQIFALSQSFTIEDLELSQAEYAKLADVSKSTVQRVFNSLTAIGWMVSVPRFGLALVNGARRFVHRTSVRGLELVSSKLLSCGSGKAKEPKRSRAIPVEPKKVRPRKQERRSARRARASSKARKSPQVAAAVHPRVEPQEKPQSAEELRARLREVALKNPFLDFCVERALAVV